MQLKKSKQIIEMSIIGEIRKIPSLGVKLRILAWVAELARIAVTKPVLADSELKYDSVSSGEIS